MVDRQLRRIAERTGSQAMMELACAGAAGGLGFALAAFFGADLRRGIEIVLEAAQLERRLAGADLCITGEGRLDGRAFRQDGCRRRAVVQASWRAMCRTGGIHRRRGGSRR